MKRGLFALAGMVAFMTLAGGACTTPAGDPPAPYDANVLGTGMRVRDVQNKANNLAGQEVNVTSVVVTAVDNFDETKDGKSRGTIYLQDVDLNPASPPDCALGGISLYAPTFIPANLRLAPGDVVNMAGQYVEQTTIGLTVDFTPNYLPQMNKPTVTFGYEMQVPAPVVIDVADLNDFNVGRKWLGLLVQVQNATVLQSPVDDGKGRVTAVFSTAANGGAISNELYDLPAGSFPANTTFKSITGVVTFFFNLKIAPRSAADLVQ